MNEQLQRYVEQIKSDLEINQINILEVAKTLPAKRHHWSARLIEHKIKASNLEKQKAHIIKEVSSNIAKSSPVGVSTRSLAGAAEASDEIRSINEQIIDQKNIIEFLESVQKNFFSVSFDLKNIIEIMKLEQL